MRKVSGMRQPSAANRAAFEAAVDEITAITQRLLLDQLQTRAEPRDRRVEAERARQRGRQREARMRAHLAQER